MGDQISQLITDKMLLADMWLIHTVVDNMFHQNHEFTSKNRADLLSLLYVIKIDTFEICATQQLID